MGMIVTARILESTSYGELALVQSSVVMLGTFAGTGMGMTTIKYVAQFHKNSPLRTGRVIALAIWTSSIMGGSIAIILFLSAPWLARETFAAAHLADALRIGSAILILNVWIGVQIGILIGFEAFRAMAKVNVISGSMGFLLIISGANWWGVPGALWGLVGSAFVTLIMNGMVIYKHIQQYRIPLFWTITAAEWKILRQFSLPAAMTGIMVGPVNWLGATLLVNEENGYAELGTFTAANQWFSLLLFVPSQITQVLMPMFTDYSGKADKGQLQRSLSMSIKLTLILVVPMAVLIMLISPFIMRLYGIGFSGGWPVLTVIALATVPAATLNLLGNVLAVENRMWTVLGSNVVWALIYVGAVILLLQLGWGALALAVAMLVAYSVRALAIGTIVFRHLKNLGLA